MKWGAWQEHFAQQDAGDELAEVSPMVRALLAFMWTPSRQENHLHGHGVSVGAEGMSGGSLNGICSQFDPHQGLLNLVDDLNSFYRAEPASGRDDFVQFGFHVD